jgi:hypothetical protein
MDSKQVIKKYLPLLQELQMKASEKHGFSVVIACDDWDISVTFSVPVDNPDMPFDIMHEHFNSGYSEDEMNQKVISLNAFYAQACITTITGINCSISLN